MDPNDTQRAGSLLGRGATMKSQNFEHFRQLQPELATHGAFAERYMRTDPGSSLAKLRNFAEVIVREIYLRRRLPEPYSGGLNDLLQQDVFKAAVPPVMCDKLHLLRSHGNKGAHGKKCDIETARRLLHVAYDVSAWFFVRDLGKPQGTLPAYVEPTASAPSGGSKAEQKRKNKALLQELSRKEAEVKEAIEAAEAARAQQAKLAERLEFTTAELNAMREQGQVSLSALGQNEAETRVTMIDVALLAAGWSVEDTSQVGVEVSVLHQPTPSGKGAADYVLWGDNGKPLAVIEAKRTSVDAENGRSQARYYADGLEKQFGQRPVIFYTNGYDTWLWDDTQKQPPRKVHGFYGKSSLEQLVFQRASKTWSSDVEPNLKICDRVAGLETIKRVTERFDDNHRKALIVQATGTGKTRVAVSLTDVLLRSNNVRHVLFLCDRKELRKQARNAFREFLPDSNPVILTPRNATEVGPQVFISTYQTMMGQFESFDVGFFDLIIADESHRSVYNYYGDIFRYFDALQLGLTATPVDFIDRNTYELFGCDEEKPTAYYGLDQAIIDKCLVPFRVVAYQTEFQREGMRYAKMSQAQKKQLEEQMGVGAEDVDYDGEALNKAIFNRDTNRHVIRNLMERGIYVKDGSELGKTIVFARNHDHAELLKSVFDELYPSYGNGFCEVIDYQNPRAEALIAEFKGIGQRNELTIAISVDMLDTGIDVKPIVNLVFAKPVRSYVKFWQMVGRGTRTCENLFGPGQDKTEFLIFDHWKNFEHFGEGYEAPPGNVVRSVQERVFAARVELARVYSNAMQQADFERTIALIEADLNSLVDSKSIEVKEERKNLDELREHQTLLDFHAVTADRLERLAPLMRWRNIRGFEVSWRFDETMTRIQIRQANTAGIADLKARVQEDVESLPKNLAQVKAKTDAINKVRDDAFWKTASATDLELLRTDLRGIMKFKGNTRPPTPSPYKTDVKEQAENTSISDVVVQNYGLDLVAYRHSVTDALNDLVHESETLQKIKRAEAVSGDDMRELSALILTQNPNVKLERLFELYPETTGRLGSAIRRVLGVDADAVTHTFDTFIQQHPHLSATQINFVRLLKRYIIEHGGIERETPYDHPFTHIHQDGLSGVFDDDDELAAPLNSLLDRFYVDRHSQPPPAH